MSTVPSAPTTARQESAPKIEELVANADAINPPEVIAARGVPVDFAATTKLKADSDRMGRLDKVIDLEDGAKVLDVAVRGANVSFVVEAADGGTHRGFVPLSALGSGRDASKAAGDGLQSSPRLGGQGEPTGGTADPDPTSHASGPGLGGTPTPGNLDVQAGSESDDDDDGPQGPDAPEGYEGLNAADAAKYVAERGEADARAALAYEQAQATPRTTVTKAGEERFPA